MYTNVFNNLYDGLYNSGTQNIPVKLNVSGFSGNLSSSFTFAKTWTTELSGWYTTSASEGLMIGRQMGAMNIDLAKQILNKTERLK